MKYKYKIGNKVKYRHTIITEKVCETCGHIEDIYKEVWKTGKITERMYDFLYHIDNGFVDTVSKRDENGMLIHAPQIKLPKVQEQEPVYKVNNTWLAEESITLLIK